MENKLSSLAKMEASVFTENKIKIYACWDTELLVLPQLSPHDLAGILN